MSAEFIHALVAVISAIVAAIFAAGGAYFGVRIHLYYMRRDIDANKEHINTLRDDKNHDVRLLHERISRRALKEDR